MLQVKRAGADFHIRTLPLAPMKRPGLSLPLLALLACAAPASAHPSPFSFIDVKLSDGTINVVIVAHIFDLAHDLGVASPELLDQTIVTSRSPTLAALVRPRFQIDADGQPVACQPSGGAELIAARDSLKFA